MTIQKKFLAFPILIFISIIGSGQNPLATKWEQHITYVKTQYHDLPKQKLDSITIFLDSTAIGTQCYQFITNPVKTKFIAFYLTDRNSSSFDLIKREYGGTYRSFTWGEMKETQIEAFAYTVIGMYYGNRWYYDVGEYVEFYADNKQEAENIFLIRTLTEMNFFIGKNPKENKKFWIKNDFAKNTYPYKKDYPNIPEVVIKASMNQEVHDNYNQNKKLEKISCLISASLWSDLHNLDSTKYHSRYKGRYMDNYCLTLYNSDRNIVLLPIIYYDAFAKAHLSYYVLKLSSSDTILYNWKLFPEKVINRNKGEEGLEVVYDIRNFIKNWGWGTVNMIGANKFWEDNFTIKDTEVSKFQYHSH